MDMARLIKAWLSYEPLQLIGINAAPSLKAKLATTLSLGRLSDTRFLQYAFVARPL